MSLPSGAVQSVSLALEALVYGLYVSAFFRCMMVLTDARGRRVPYLILTGVLLSSFAVATAHFVAGFCLNIQNIIHNTTPIYTVVNRLRDCLYITATLIANAFLIYRCFTIWNKKRRVILIPSIICVADVALGIWYAFMRGREELSSGHVLMLSRLFCSLTLALNLVSSCMIIYRIWSIQYELSRFLEQEKRALRRAITLIIESGALYSVMLLAFLISSYVSSAAMRIIRGCIVPLLGLVVSAIIHRIGKGTSHGDAISSIPVEFRSSGCTTKGSYLLSPGKSAPLATDVEHRISEIPLGIRRGDQLGEYPERRIDLNN